MLSGSFPHMPRVIVPQYGPNLGSGFAAGVMPQTRTNIETMEDYGTRLLTESESETTGVSVSEETEIRSKMKLFGFLLAWLELGSTPLQLTTHG